MLLLGTAARFSLTDQHGQSVGGRGWIWLCLFVNSEPPSRFSRKRSVLGSSTKLKLRLSVSYTSHHRTIRKQARSKTNRLQQDRRLTRLHLDLIHNKIEQAHPATRHRPPPRARGCGPGRGGPGSGARAEASRSKGRRRSRGTL